MWVWPILLLGSLLLGAGSAALSRSNFGLLWGAIVPVTAWFLALMYNEYFVPYTGGGASFWPLALIFGGIPASSAGMVGAWLVLERRSRKSRRGNGDAGDHAPSN